MTEREALMRAVCENPDDDTPRLVFADWLDENGDPERAEFIRLQVQFAAMYRVGVPTTDSLPPSVQRDPPTGPNPETIRKRERAIWAVHKDTFRARLPEIPGVAWFPEFHRGFVEMMTVNNDAQLVRQADVIFNQLPIQHVEIDRFKAADGFATLPYLRRLKTLKLNNRRANEGVVRRLAACQQLGESTLLFVRFGLAVDSPLQILLRQTFGSRIRIVG